jgi:hypothetical protein
MIEVTSPSSSSLLSPDDPSLLSSSATSVCSIEREIIDVEKDLVHITHYVQQLTLLLEEKEKEKEKERYEKYIFIRTQLGNFLVEGKSREILLQSLSSSEKTSFSPPATISGSGSGGWNDPILRPNPKTVGAFLFGHELGLANLAFVTGPAMPIINVISILIIILIFLLHFGIIPASPWSYIVFSLLLLINIPLYLVLNIEVSSLVLRTFDFWYQFAQGVGTYLSLWLLWKDERQIVALASFLVLPHFLLMEAGPDKFRKNIVPAMAVGSVASLINLICIYYDFYFNLNSIEFHIGPTQWEIKQVYCSTQSILLLFMIRYTVTALWWPHHFLTLTMNYRRAENPTTTPSIPPKTTDVEMSKK